MVVKQVTTVAHNHESFLDSQGNTQSTNSGLNIPPDELSDLHIPIALRKGKISCTIHPISDFVSYDKLSPK